MPGRPRTICRWLGHVRCELLTRPAGPRPLRSPGARPAAYARSRSPRRPQRHGPAHARGGGGTWPAALSSWASPPPRTGAAPVGGAQGRGLSHLVLRLLRGRNGRDAATTPTRPGHTYLVFWLLVACVVVHDVGGSGNEGTSSNGPHGFLLLGTTTSAFAQFSFPDRDCLEPLGVPHLGRTPNDPGQKIMPKMQDSSSFVFFLGGRHFTNNR